jgi:hypothetical protein
MFESKTSLLTPRFPESTFLPARRAAGGPTQNNWAEQLVGEYAETNVTIKFVIFTKSFWQVLTKHISWRHLLQWIPRNTQASLIFSVTDKTAAAEVATGAEIQLGRKSASF